MHRTGPHSRSAWRRIASMKGSGGFPCSLTCRSSSWCASSWSQLPPQRLLHDLASMSRSDTPVMTSTAAPPGMLRKCDAGCRGGPAHCCTASATRWTSTLQPPTHDTPAGPPSSASPKKAVAGGSPTAAARHSADFGVDPLVVEFRGGSAEFQQRFAGTRAIVFFHKLSGGPSEPIRARLLHAVADCLTRDASRHAAAASNPPLGGTVNETMASSFSVTSDRVSAAGDAAWDRPCPPIAASSSPSPSFSAVSAHGIPVLRDAAEVNVDGASAQPAASMSPEEAKMFETVYRTLRETHQGDADPVLLVKVNTSKNKRLTALHDIRSLPTVIAYNNDCIVDRVEGAREIEVQNLVIQLVKSELGSKTLEDETSSTDN